MRRALLAALVLTVVVALAGVIWFTRSLDARVERYLERLGSELLGVPVRLASVDVVLRESRATLRGLEVANPRGDYSSRPALRVDEIVVGIEATSLAGTPIVLREVTVGAPFVNLEVSEGGINLLALSNHLANVEPEQADAAAADEPPSRFRIDALRIQEGTLRVDASAVDRGVREIELGDFTRRKLGGASGSTPGELGQEVLGPFLKTVLAKVASDRVGELLDEQLDRAKEELSESLRSILGVKRKKKE